MATKTMVKRQPGTTLARQRGAVLYVALMILVLMALIGVAGMQVAGLQERMTADYYTISRAFQNAEGVVREVERRLSNQVNAGSANTVAIDDSQCTASGFDSVGWANAKSRKSNVHVRRIDRCVAGLSSAAQGRAPVREDPNLMFQVTAYATDGKASTASDAVVDTVFIP